MKRMKMRVVSRGVVLGAVLAVYAVCGAEYGPFTPRNSNGKSKLKVVLLGMTPAFESELELGKPLVIKNAADGQDVDGPRVVEAKRDASGAAKKWFIKSPRDCVMTYKPRTGALTLKMWRELPGAVVLETRGPAAYMLINISGGPDAAAYTVSYQADAPQEVSDFYKTGRIVLRRLEAGTYAMGSPGDELGRRDEEIQHTVTLTRPFYISIYEITQAQYSNVMGAHPAYFAVGSIARTRPAEQVAWDTVRGGTWPNGVPGAATFMGRLRARTGLSCDLPTEAQWEYACRAGTVTALNNGQNLTSQEQDGALDALGRYWYNGGHFFHSNDYVNGGTAPVGMYLQNNWALYGLHGNVGEWCLDWYGNYGGDEADPAGPATGIVRVVRGGAWVDPAMYCRAASRRYAAPEGSWYDIGFRLVIPADQ